MPHPARSSLLSLSPLLSVATASFMSASRCSRPLSLCQGTTTAPPGEAAIRGAVPILGAVQEAAATASQGALAGKPPSKRPAGSTPEFARPGLAWGAVNKPAGGVTGRSGSSGERGVEQEPPVVQSWEEAHHRRAAAAGEEVRMHRRTTSSFFLVHGHCRNGQFIAVYYFQISCSSSYKRGMTKLLWHNIQKALAP